METEKDNFTIHFKNGNTLLVSRQIAEGIRDVIVNGSAKQWQAFSDSNGNKLIVMINTHEVTHIS